MKTLIKNAHVISPGVDLKKANVVIERGRIKAVTQEPVAGPFETVVDAKGKYVVPGFIDVHLHGACGYDVCDEDRPEAIEKIAEAKLAEGCTTFLPTTLTVANKTLVAAAKHLAAYQKNQRFAKAPGLHLEGPFINPACCGAQNPAFVRKPDIKEVLKIAKIAPVLQVSYAPEMKGGAEFAAACIKNGIVPSCGHTGATLAQLMPAYKNGLRHMTHFCNQMTKLHHREIGMVGAGFLIDDLDTEVICDRGASRGGRQPRGLDALDEQGPQEHPRSDRPAAKGHHPRHVVEPGDWPWSRQETRQGGEGLHRRSRRARSEDLRRQRRIS